MLFLGHGERLFSPRERKLSVINYAVYRRENCTTVTTGWAAPAIGAARGCRVQSASMLARRRANAFPVWIFALFYARGSRTRIRRTPKSPSLMPRVDSSSRRTVIL